jgi:hypothetical protein
MTSGRELTDADCMRILSLNARHVKPGKIAHIEHLDIRTVYAVLLDAARCHYRRVASSRLDELADPH